MVDKKSGNMVFLLSISTLGNLTLSSFFFFNDTATTEIYTLSLHDALPIWVTVHPTPQVLHGQWVVEHVQRLDHRSEEHTSELQSPCNLVCRLLLEKKKKEIRTSQRLRIVILQPDAKHFEDRCIRITGRGRA